MTRLRHPGGAPGSAAASTPTWKPPLQPNAQVAKFWILALAAVQALGLLRDIGFGMLGAGLILRGLLVVPVLCAIAIALGGQPSRGRVAWLTSVAVMTSIGVQFLLALIADLPYADRYSWAQSSPTAFSTS